MNTLSSPPTQQSQHRLLNPSTMHIQQSNSLQLAHYEEAKPTLHEANCEWSNTPPATPVTPTDKIHKTMMIQSPLHLKQSLLSTSPSFTTMDVTTTGATSLNDDTFPGRELLAHSSNHRWDVYADMQNGLKMDYPKVRNRKR
ncbi:hypothetical protein BCR42DRAFT_14925 [Absidia repens]|uniref:Uncharacterized protein n=1 Tax=Absidia repens TaxID=90262 RepID=A0A1X2J1W0_9FUNG|nr:hypothetical protein BCR42DRAFT_14925 [Absidia repens]